MSALLSRLGSVTPDANTERRQAVQQVRHLTQERYRRNSQPDLAAHLDASGKLTTLDSCGSLSSRGSTTSSTGTPAAGHEKPAGPVPAAHEDPDAAPELTRSLEDVEKGVDRRLGAFDQISLISTLLVGTAAGALLVVDREKVGQFQCGLDQQPASGFGTDGSAAGNAICDATEIPAVVWVAVIPMHLTIGLNLFVTLVFVLVAFNTKRTMGWGEGYVPEAEIFFDKTTTLRIIALSCFYLSIPFFLVGLGATSHILLPMGTMVTSTLMTLYLTLIVGVLYSICFVHRVAETLRQDTDKQLKDQVAKLKTELALARMDASKPVGLAATMEGTTPAITTAATSSHPSSTLLTHHETAPLLGVHGTLVAQVQESADLQRIESTGSDFATVAELEESTEVPPYRAGATRR